MRKEKHYEAGLKEIKESKERIDMYERMLKNKEDGDFLQNMVEQMKEELKSFTQQFNFNCCVDSKRFMNLLCFVLNEVELEKYEVHKEGDIYTIRVVDEPESKIDISADEKINLNNSVFLDESSYISQKFPYLSSVVLDLLNYNTNPSVLRLSEEQIFEYIKKSFPIEYDHLYSESKRIKMDERFKSLALEFAKFSVEYDDFYDVSKEAEQDFFESLKNGDYNDLLKASYWFGSSISGKGLPKYHVMIGKLKDKGYSNNLSIENYIVFCAVDDFMNRVNYLNKYKEDRLSINGLYQTAPTEEENKEISTLVEQVLCRDFNWREAREVVRNVSRLRMFQDHEFPHNIEKIKKAFNPEVITYYDKLDDTLSLKRDLSEVQYKARKLIESISEEGIIAIFPGENETWIDEYLRNMVLSQYKKIDLIDGYNTHSLEDEKKVMTINECKSTGEIPFDILGNILLYNRNKKELESLAKGVLISLCNNQEPINIFDTCIDLQKKQNCWKGTVGVSDVNILQLPNGDKIYSTYCEDIEPQYKRFQKEYRHYYDKSSDLEFVEGVTEVVGNVAVSQIFRLGNKRTAKCLFNSLLVSRGILPPIIDLNANDMELWNDFAYGRFERYPKARLKVLRETINTNKKIEDSQYTVPHLIPKK